MNRSATPGNQPDPAARLAEALRARATAAGTGYPPAARSESYPPGPPQAATRHAADQALRRQIMAALAIALVAGVLLGVAIGVVSLAMPGVLPAFG